MNLSTLLGAGGSVLDSIQHGRVTLDDVTSHDITITEVDLSRSILLISSNNTSTTASSEGRNTWLYRLSSSTNIALMRSTGSSFFKSYVQWAVLEFKEGILEAQHVYKSQNNAYADVAWSAVTLANTIILFNGNNPSGDDGVEVYHNTAHLTTTGTRINITRNDDPCRVAVQVIELL